MHIHCLNCVLRPLVPTDAATLATHANDREIRLNLCDRFPHPYSPADAACYITSLADRVPQTSFGIVVDGEAAR